MLERQNYFFDGFRAVGDVRHASQEVGRELGVERQECGPTAGSLSRRALAPSSVSSSRARFWLGGSARWPRRALARRQCRRAAWRVAVNTPSQPAVCSGGGRARDSSQGPVISSWVQLIALAQGSLRCEAVHERPVRRRDDCRCSSGLALRRAASMSQCIEALSGRAGLQCASIAATHRSTARLRASVHHQLSVAASCERHSAFTARRSKGLAAEGLIPTTVNYSAELLQRCGHGAPWRPLLAATSLAHAASIGASGATVLSETPRPASTAR